MIMNERYSAAMVGFAVSGATDWVWIPCKLLFHEQNMDRNKDFDIR